MCYLFRGKIDLDLPISEGSIVLSRGYLLYFKNLSKYIKQLKMDKTLKRQTRFKKQNAVRPEKPVKPKGFVSEADIGAPKPDKPKKEPSAQERSERLYKWLLSHPFIALRRVCESVETDRPNFLKALKDKKAQKGVLLDKFEAVLKP